MKTSGMVARVKNEVEIHCQLKHPSVLEVIGLSKNCELVTLKYYH